MRLFKIAALSSVILVMGLFTLWLIKQSRTEGAAYKSLIVSIKEAAGNPHSLTQVKETVERAYWFLNKETPLSIKISYPISQVFHDEGLVEEMFDLSALSTEGLAQNRLEAHKGRLDFAKSLFIMEGAHLQSFKKKTKTCDAFADDLILDLKNASPTFVAHTIKAEIRP